MGSEDIAGALRRVQSVLHRRPEAGRHDDSPARVRWDGGLQTVADGAPGVVVRTDMPPEIGGAGALPTPGWLLRAALASCAITRIAMAAAAEGIALDRLEARAFSRSDARGLLGMAGADGTPVPAGPDDVRLEVHIGAAGVAPQRLRALVEAAHGCSPVTAALTARVPVALRVEIDGEFDAHSDAVAHERVAGQTDPAFGRPPA
jgi:uncharacterized OsmC-like protein